MNIGRYDKTKIYIHSLLKFKSKEASVFPWWIWDVGHNCSIYFCWQNQNKKLNPRRVWELSIFPWSPNTESLNGGKGKWDHSPTSSSPSQRWKTTPLIIFYIGQRGKLAFSSPTICCWHHSSPANSTNHKWKFPVRFWTTFSNPDSNSIRTKLSSLVQCIVQAVIISTSCHH